MLLVFPEALSGWTSQAKCCKQMYYEQPYCVCRVAPICAPFSCNLTALQPYSQQLEETLSPNSFSVNNSWLIAWAFSNFFNWWQTTANQHWLDYVTKSEVDITALTHWLDCMPQVPQFALGQTSALPWPEADITALSIVTAPDQRLFLLGL